MLRLRHLLAGIGLAACGKTAAPPAPRTVEVMTVDASAPVVLPDAGDTTVRAPYFDKAILLANGHVLMPTKDQVFDWDPFGAMRSAGLGDAGPAHTFSFAPVGGRRFVVAKMDEDDNTHYELWDAEKLTRIKELGLYVAEDPMVVFSADGARAMILSCAKVKADHRACEVGVHDLATGDLVHRTKIPPFQVVDGQGIDGELAPTGRYFVLRTADRPPEAWDAATGRMIFRVPDPKSAQVWDAWFDTTVFVDDRHLLTVSDDGRVHRLTDLATGKSKTLVRPGASSCDPHLSRDRKYVASRYQRPDGHDAVLVWDLATGASVEHVVPPEACEGTCSLGWIGPSTAVLPENGAEAPTRFVIDLATNLTRIEPSREPPHFERFGAHPVQGRGFTLYGTAGWHPDDDDLVSPRGARFPIAKLDMTALTSVSGDRFFFDGLEGLRVLDASGKIGEIARAIPPP